MTFSTETKEALAAKLDPSAIKARTQAGRQLSYIEGWHTIAEANRIFGFDGWTRETCRLDETNRELLTLKGNNGEYQQWRVGYLCVVKVTAGGVVRQGTGFGSGMGKPEALGDAIESAIKEAETDAMKRALMTFGWPFGLALYDKSQEHVEKPEPQPKVPPKVVEPPKPGEFWSRSSLELKATNIKNLLDFASAFEAACKKAPSLDHLLKLETDNDAHLAALHGQSPSAHKQAKTVLGVEMQKFTHKAA